MKLEKKAFAIMEILIYFVIIAFIGLASYNIIANLIVKMEEKKEKNIFFKNYNNFVSNMLENTGKGWQLDSTTLTGIVLENNGKKIGYACENNGIYQTPIGSGNINWNIKENYFSGFKCNQLTGQSNVYSGFFIKVNILEDQEYKYFLKN